MFSLNARKEKANVLCICEPVSRIWSCDNRAKQQTKRPQEVSRTRNTSIQSLLWYKSIEGTRRVQVRQARTGQRPRVAGRRPAVRRVAVGLAAKKHGLYG